MRTVDITREEDVTESGGGEAAPQIYRPDTDRRIERKRRLVRWAQQRGVFFGLLALIGFFATLSDRFLTIGNLRTVALQVAVIGIVAIPGAMLVLSGYVDLSVGSVMILAAVGFGQVYDAGVPVGWAALVGLGIGLAWGLVVNGYLIAYRDFSPIVVTLGGLALARGLAEAWSQGVTIFGFGDAFGFVGIGRWLGVPVPVWIFLAVIVIGHYVWNIGPWGRRMTAIGSSPEAALSLGVRVRMITFGLYGASGMAAAAGGLIFTAQLDGASLSIGQGLELQVLTAILLGGVSFAGGRGSMSGLLSGILFMGVLRNGLVLTGVGVFWQQAAIGAALLFAAFFDVLYRRLERLAVDDHEEDDKAGTSETNGSETTGTVP